MIETRQDTNHQLVSTFNVLSFWNWREGREQDMYSVHTGEMSRNYSDCPSLCYNIYYKFYNAYCCI